MSDNPIFKGSNVTPKVIARAGRISTPQYLYDEKIIVDKCKEVLAMPNAFGLNVRYAMKANSNMALLQLITDDYLCLDCSSMGEVKRAHDADIPYDIMMLTTQEVPIGEDREKLEEMMLDGLKYNVCSLRQLGKVADFAAEHDIPLSIRVHPGVGSGESSTRNTGDKYSCFGIHLTDLERALEIANDKGVIFDQVHDHIGSGGDPEKWRGNIDILLQGFVGSYFPDAETVSFGGGLREARMPDETPADIQELGRYAALKIEDFYECTGRKLRMEIEPGTYVVANSGFLITKVIDKKQTGPDGFEFLIVDGGMEVNTRPLLYGSKHPFYVVSKDGELLSSEFELDKLDPNTSKKVIVGKCCESGDSQSLDEEGHILERLMADPKVGDYVVIGGAGAYCSSMSPFNYNSHLQCREALLREDGAINVIRMPQQRKQITQNEKPLKKF
ncbi:diaminopimelate decarboxylase [Candidatus Woesearchaeota archaeon]|nr:diaminopimelate decarboxylase [Candidatus Woesearchaeota archaeon]